MMDAEGRGHAGSHHYHRQADAEAQHQWRCSARTRAVVVAERSLSRNVRAFATPQFDERCQFVVAPKFSGLIKKLAVNATGDTV